MFPFFLGISYFFSQAPGALPVGRFLSLWTWIRGATAAPHVEAAAPGAPALVPGVSGGHWDQVGHSGSCGVADTASRWQHHPPSLRPFWHNNGVFVWLGNAESVS